MNDLCLSLKIEKSHEVMKEILNILENNISGE